jgi:cytochrome P450
LTDGTVSTTDPDERKLYGDLEEQGFNNEITEGPVEDWATDFDHLDEVWAANPYPILDGIRSSGCPVAHTDRYGGAWLPTTHEDVAAVAYDTDHFSSRMVVVGNHRPPFETAPQGVSPPISSDPPFHHDARRLLLPAFAPKAIEALEPATREFCHSLLSSLEGKDVVDAAVEYAQHIPVRVIAHMLGFPLEDADRFREFVKNVLEGVNTPMEERIVDIQALFEYLDEQVADRVAHPRDDLTSFLLNAKMGDEALTEEHVTGTMALLLIAGIDTTWSAIGASIWHLADHPADRQRLVDEPELLPVAMEELLRAYAPVTMARLVKDDMEWNGCPMKRDDWILLSFPSANRDPEAFERAGEVVIDREVNRHAAFGLGIHRCIGSHLARMEVRVALEVWLEHFPVFSLADPEAVTWSAGQVRGPRTLPVTIGS